MNHEFQMNVLADVATRLAKKYEIELLQLKQKNSELNRSDFIWHFLLQSFSTMGRADGWHGLIGNKENYNRVTFESLEKLDSTEREYIVHSTCRQAKIRMPGKKAEYILGCFNYIKDLGGLQEANKQLFNTCGREKKIEFLKTFPGIGDKYARNIMMDVYHEEFRDSIAIDVRIKSISDILGISFDNYVSHEYFYLESARRAKLNGWEMDRLIFNYINEFKRELASVIPGS